MAQTLKATQKAQAHIDAYYRSAHLKGVPKAVAESILTAHLQQVGASNLTTLEAIDRAKRDLARRYS